MVWSARAQALLLITAGAVAASDVTLNIGDTLSASIATGYDTNVPCYLETPYEETIEFRPENHSTDRISYLETSNLSYCGAKIADLKEEDEGDWTIYYISGDERVSNTYHLTISKAGNEESEEINENAETELTEEEANTEWLPEISISTRTGFTVDITLSKKVDPSLEEIYSVITPNNEMFYLDNANIEGLTVHGRSNFVDSRITIGPMDSSLIGRWTLCGHVDGDIPARRCQVVGISWENPDNPSAEWQTTVLSRRDTVTNYLATVNVSISGSGSRLSCHLIEPAGGDLMITRESTYPGLTLVATRDNSLCTITMTPIYKEFIGDWVLYGTFRSSRGERNEVRVPLHLFLYDVENPYSQAYNVTNLNPLSRVVSLGSTTTLDSAGSGTTDSCELRSPSGESYNLQNSTAPVSFLASTSSVRCRASIGPIRLDILGDWVLIAKFNRNGIFTENRQVISIRLQEEEVLRDINISTRTGLTIDISLSRKDLESLEETFTLTTPQNEVIDLGQNSIPPGLTVHDSSDFVAKRVSVGPMEESLLGRWTLCGEVNTEVTVTRCQSVVISWDDANNPSEEWETSVLTKRNTVTNYLAVVNVTVSGSGTLLNCHLITPQGEDLIVTTDSAYPGINFITLRDTSVCTVTMGPIHKEFIGDWILYGNFRSSRGVRNEVRLPFLFFLYDEENPYSQAYNVSTLNPLTRVITLGSFTNLDLSGSGSTDSCELRSPSGISYNLQNSTAPVSFLATTSSIRCRASIGPMGLEELGDWVYIAKFNNRGIFTENRQTISLILEEEQLLREISINTRTGLTVDITLGKTEMDPSLVEKFTITTPQDEVVALEHANVPGLTVHGSSEFVASRVTIGPMDSSLIGRWTLCGEVNVGRPVRRCQPVIIAWYNANNPSEEWQNTLMTRVEVVTNYLAVFNSTVRGSGTLLTCHLITPYEEDLVVNGASVYPGLTFQTLRDTSVCTVTMGPIQKEFIGDWVLYATFRSSRGDRNDVRLPFNLFLYDKDNPYSQAYNVTNMAPLIRVINPGSSVTSDVIASGNTDSCEVISPSGKSYNLQNSTQPVTFGTPNSNIRCRVTIGPVGLDDFGDWEFRAKHNTRGIFTEHRQIISILQEDPENPVAEDHRNIINMDPIYFITAIDAQHTIVADPNTNTRFVTESCHVRTANGLQYAIMEGFNLPGVEVVQQGSNQRCTIRVNVKNEDFIGEWMLISREQRNSVPVEVRQPFIIFVEEDVDASIGHVTVTEGNDLHLRLANSTNLHETCKVFDPTGSERTNAEKDNSQIETCGFIVRNVQNEDTGAWQIRYGTGISYRAIIDVKVKDLWEATHDTLVLIRGRPVNETIGPETAVYCKLIDPTQRVIFDGHGRCHLNLDRVTNDHAGTWVMSVGFLGNMLARTYEINVEARGSQDKPIVETHVAKEQPEVTLKCSVPLEYEVRSCLFQKPSGRVIIVNTGVAEDRYISYGSGTIVDGNVTSHECGIRITDPATADLGLWRCAVETDHEVYYGFLTVLCPWAMKDPVVAAAVVSEPTLTSHQDSIMHLEGDSLTMSCSIQSPIRYCYFRRPNGMIYTVSTGVSTDEYEYVGAGLDAGECGIRFSRLLSQETGHWPEGQWSCHVGLPDGAQPEQRANIQIQINRPIEVNQYVNERGLVVEAEVFQQQPVEYCRYVRIDGIGFTSEALPDSRYTAYEDLSKGFCSISIQNANILDMHPWTVVAKIVDRDEEVSGVTNHTIVIPDLTTELPDMTTELSEATELPETTEVTEKPEPPPEDLRTNSIWMWCTVMLSGLILVCVSVILTRNRKDVIATAYSWRNSIRRSLIKKPLTEDVGVGHTTPVCA
ncbi:uncharacterized protein LOC106131619 [Amyelois transitella]|uniref:uncharacterized protein LOC106131619 n=1 Tax=Amyelois transitella TaxID=680683 RepID=UPI002990702F|nr:uncharacterized protein LOC106131619 [Amyelois transitella]